MRAFPRITNAAENAAIVVATDGLEKGVAGMIIPGEKVLLRPIEPEDFPTLVAWGNDAEITAFIEGDYPRTVAECPEWYQNGKANRHSQRFAIGVRSEKGDRLIGDIELDHIAWRSGDAELRIRIGEKECWDQGYGTEAVHLLVEHAFERMNLARIYLRVFSSNKRAIRCYEKCGFRKEGRMRRQGAGGAPVVVYLMRLLKSEFVSDSSSDVGHRRGSARPA